MKTEKFKGSVESAYGKVLPTAVAFEGEYGAYETISEVPTEERLSPADELSVVNNKRKASARATATTAALEAAGIQKPDQNSPEVMRENMIKTAMKLYKVDEAVATKIVDAAASAASQLS